MAFFLPSSTSTSTTTSLSSSPLPVLRPLDSEDESEESHNESLMHQSDNNATARTGFTMFGLLSRQIDYISGASASDISSLEESSESEVESWSQRVTVGDDDGERSPRSTREDARSPSRRRRSPQIHEVVESHEPSAGTSQSAGLHQTPRTFEPNLASSTNQIEEEEAVKRRRRSSHRRHGSTEANRSARRGVKLRNRRDHVFEGFISRDFFLIITLCFGLACAWMVLARPIMMNWFESRSGDGYMYMGE